MEEDGDGEDLTPFWVQSTTNLRHADRLRRGIAAVFFSSGLVVFLLLVTAVFFLVFVVPSTISFSASIFRPSSVKKSWDSLNIVLVLVAVVFGFLSRNRNEERFSSFDESQPSPVKENESQKSNPSTPNKWFNYSTNDEQKSNLSPSNQWYDEYQDYQPKFEQKSSILRRSSSSYPDLREFPSSNSTYGDYQKRFLDDFYVDSSRGSDPSQLHHRRHRSLEQVDYLRPPPQTKTVIVDTLVSKSTEATDFPATLSSPPLPEFPSASPVGDEEIAKKVIYESAVVRKERSSRRFYKDMEVLNPISAPKPPLPPAEESPPPEYLETQRRSNERAARKKDRSSRKQNKDMEVEPTHPNTTPPQQPPPPPPPPPPPQQKGSKSERKRGGGTGNSTKDFLNSLYHKKKRKQRQKSVDNMDSLLHEAQPPLSFQIPPPSPHPPPPPPPPPPSVFHNLFSSKKQKRRTITVTLEPRPPSPPEAPQRGAAREPRPTSQAAAPLPNHKPPKPVKMNSFDRLDEASNSGGESPLSRIPPPPPPPPPSFLKNPAWKFVVQGDYVRVNSNNSSRSGSPDLDEADSDVTPSASDGGDVTAFHPSPLFCPSPDVNTKAESFITNFRAKLKLEKIHSMKKRDVGPSTLGPGPN